MQCGENRPQKSSNRQAVEYRAKHVTHTNRNRTNVRWTPSTQRVEGIWPILQLPYQLVGGRLPTPAITSTTAVKKTGYPLTQNPHAPLHPNSGSLIEERQHQNDYFWWLKHNATGFTIFFAYNDG